MTILRDNDKFMLMVFDPRAHEELLDNLNLLCSEFTRRYPQDHFTSYVQVPRYATDPEYHARLVVGPNIWASEQFWRRVVELELEFG